MTGEVEEAEEVDEVEEPNKADGTRDSRYVASSNKGLADAVTAAFTLTTYPLAQKILTRDQKKRPNNSKPKRTTLHGKDSSSLHHHQMTPRQWKDSGKVLSQFSMETIEIGSRCCPATLMMMNSTVDNTSTHF